MTSSSEPDNIGFCTYTFTALRSGIKNKFWMLKKIGDRGMYHKCHPSRNANRNGTNTYFCCPK